MPPGYDFFVPEDLTVFDFTRDASQYLDSHVVWNKNMPYPVSFVLEVAYPPPGAEKTADRSEWPCVEVQLVLKWSPEGGGRIYLRVLQAGPGTGPTRSKCFHTRSSREMSSTIS